MYNIMDAQLYRHVYEYTYTHAGVQVYEHTVVYLSIYTHVYIYIYIISIVLWYVFVVFMNIKCIINKFAPFNQFYQSCDVCCFLLRGVSMYNISAANGEFYWNPPYVVLELVIRVWILITFMTLFSITTTTIATTTTPTCETSGLEISWEGLTPPPTSSMLFQSFPVALRQMLLFRSSWASSLLGPF